MASSTIKFAELIACIHKFANDTHCDMRAVEQPIDANDRELFAKGRDYGKPLRVTIHLARHPTTRGLNIVVLGRTAPQTPFYYWEIAIQRMIQEKLASIEFMIAQYSTFQDFLKVYAPLVSVVSAVPVDREIAPDYYVKTKAVMLTAPITSELRLPDEIRDAAELLRSSPSKAFVDVVVPKATAGSSSWAEATWCAALYAADFGAFCGVDRNSLDSSRDSYQVRVYKSFFTELCRLTTCLEAGDRMLKGLVSTKGGVRCELPQELASTWESGHLTFSVATSHTKLNNDLVGAVLLVRKHLEYVAVDETSSEQTRVLVVRKGCAEMERVGPLLEQSQVLYRCADSRVGAQRSRSATPNDRKRSRPDDEPAEWTPQEKRAIDDALEQIRSLDFPFASTNINSSRLRDLQQLAKKRNSFTAVSIEVVQGTLDLVRRANNIYEQAVSKMKKLRGNETLTVRILSRAKEHRDVRSMIINDAKKKFHFQIIQSKVGSGEREMAEMVIGKNPSSVPAIESQHLPLALGDIVLPPLPIPEARVVSAPSTATVLCGPRVNPGELYSAIAPMQSLMPVGWTCRYHPDAGDFVLFNHLERQAFLDARSITTADSATRLAESLAAIKRWTQIF